MTTGNAGYSLTLEEGLETHPLLLTPSEPHLLPPILSGYNHRLSFLHHFLFPYVLEEEDNVISERFSNIKIHIINSYGGSGMEIHIQGGKETM